MGALLSELFCGLSSDIDYTSMASRVLAADFERAFRLLGLKNSFLVFAKRRTG